MLRLFTEFPKEALNKVMELTLTELKTKANINHTHEDLQHSIDVIDEDFTNHTHNQEMHTTDLERTLWNKKIGQIMAGISVRYEYDKTGSGKKGAEVLNDYDPRTYSSDGTPVTGNIAVGLYSSARGSLNSSIGDFSATDGGANTAKGMYSYANGCKNIATGGYSDVSGLYNIANNYQTVRGIYNKESKSQQDLFIVGNGTGVNSRSNCLRLNSTSGLFINGTYNTNGADYAEYFEWEDGNPNNEDRIGLLVTLHGDKIALAGEYDRVLGIVSATPSVSGDSYDDEWSGKYERDIYGRIVMEEVDIPEESIMSLDPDTNEQVKTIIVESHKEIRPKLSENYDPTQEYIPRSERSEWDVIGLMGKLVLIDDGTAVVNKCVRPSANGIVTISEYDTNMQVMKRLDETHVLVFFY